MHDTVTVRLFARMQRNVKAQNTNNEQDKLE